MNAAQRSSYLKAINKIKNYGKQSLYTLWYWFLLKKVGSNNNNNKSKRNEGANVSELILKLLLWNILTSGINHLINHVFSVGYTYTLYCIRRRSQEFAVSKSGILQNSCKYTQFVWQFLLAKTFLRKFLNPGKNLWKYWSLNVYIFDYRNRIANIL